MQRPYSRFPGNGPGIALFLLRIAVGATITGQGIAGLTQMQELGIGTLTVCLLGIAGGVALMIGFLIPVACALGILGGWGIVLSPPASWNFFRGNPLSLDLLIVIVALGLLGPGAYSLDARLFGRRKVVIPRPSHSSTSGVSGLGSSVTNRGSGFQSSPSRSPESSASSSSKNPNFG